MQTVTIVETEWSQIRRLKQEKADLLAALEAAEKLCKKALPEFDWGKSALSAESIRLLNEVPGQIHAAIAKAKAGKG